MISASLFIRPTVSVIISTFNGEKYISTQLDSILGQSFLEDIEVLIRDDGSTDLTLELVNKFACANRGRVRVLEPDGVRLGPKSSFAKLLSEAAGVYIAFCDQDDFWQPEKLALQVRALRDLEVIYGPDIPLLCCSDASVTDADLRVENSSFFRKHNILSNGNQDQALSRLIFRNYAIGATSLMNRKLAQLCVDIPNEAIMHDWWAALIATCLGKVTVLRRPLILYRQHGRNAVGSHRRAFPKTVKQLVEYRDLTLARTEACLWQASALEAKLVNLIPAEVAEILRDFTRFSGFSTWARLTALLRRRAFKSGVLLNGVHLYCCLRASAGGPPASQ